MPRSIWSGYISFGLVAIPVSLYPVEKKNDLHFHLLDSRDKSRVRYERVNSETGKEIPWNDIVKAYEFDKNNYIIIDEKEFQKASPKTFKSIEIEEFVDLKDVDYLYFDKPYYLLPDTNNKKAYVLLREALRKTNKVGVAKVVIRQKEYLSLILSHQDALILYLIRYQQEIRNASELSFPTQNLSGYNIVDKEIKMAVDLIKEMHAPWQPEKYHNEYRDILMNWIEDKIPDESQTTLQPKSTGKRDDVIDFMTLLKQSMKKKSATSNTSQKNRKKSTK